MAKITNAAQAAQAAAEASAKKAAEEKKTVITNPAQAAQASAQNPVAPQIQPQAPVPTSEEGRKKTMEENAYNPSFYQGESELIFPKRTRGTPDVPHSEKPVVEKQSDALAPIAGESPGGTTAPATTDTATGTGELLGGISKEKTIGRQIGGESKELFNSDMENKTREKPTVSIQPIPTGGGDGLVDDPAVSIQPVEKDTAKDPTLSIQPIEVNATNKYLDELTNKKFEYNPATDAGYQQAVAAAENAIIQSMIGRGGIYSSVAQSAVSAKLSGLTIEYEKLAYDKYVAERSFLFDLASFEQNRINTAWEQNFSKQKFSADQANQKAALDFSKEQFAADQAQWEAEFNLSREQFASDEEYKKAQMDFSKQQFAADQAQREYDNEMARNEYEFEVEKEMFDRRMQLAEESVASSKAYSSAKKAQADQDFAATGISIEAQLEKNQDKLSKFEQMRSAWEKSGKASSAVAAYFSDYGIQYGDNVATNMNVIIQRHKQLEAEKQQLIARRRSLADADLDRKFIASYSI